MCRQIVFSVVGLILLATFVFAQPPAKSAPITSLAVDVVSLKSGRSLRGAILQRSVDAVTLAVSRRWLQTTNPALFAQYDASNQAARKEAWQQARDRIAAWLETPPDAPRLLFFLESELDRLDKLLAAEEPESPPFLLIELPAGQIAKVTPASPERQRLAVLAWSEDWPDVETRDANSLRIELTKQKIKLDGPMPDLSGRLPARSQTEPEWAARLAVWDYVYRQPIDFQGMGDTLVRTGADQKPDLSAVCQNLLQQQVDSVLRDLLAEGHLANIPDKPNDGWLAPAIAAAKSADAKGFRVTRVQLDPQTARVGVVTRFVARLANNEWKTVWLTTEFADGSVARPEIEARIEQDPQVKSALGSIKSLGLIDDAPLRQAIRMGAATMSAQQAADGRFSAFIESYSQRADGPPLLVPGN